MKFNKYKILLIYILTSNILKVYFKCNKFYKSYFKFILKNNIFYAPGNCNVPHVGYTFLTEILLHVSKFLCIIFFTKS